MEDYMKLKVKNGVLNLEHKGVSLPSVTHIEVQQSFDDSHNGICVVTIKCFAIPEDTEFQPLGM